jgi:acyl dehydratase
MPAPAGYSTATLRDFVGHDFGAGDPVTVGQPRIDGFADVTGDRQWIHVDVARARAESPFGSTIAHGFLILSLVSDMRKSEGFRIVGHGNALNYGIDGLRFIRPVPVDSAVHCRTRLQGVEAKDGGTMIELGLAVHVVGQDVPCLVLRWKLFYRP